MSLKNNPLSEDKNETKDMWADDDCVGKNDTAYGTVTTLKEHDVHPIIKGIVDAWKFIFESMWHAVKEIGTMLFAICILILLVILFVCMPVLATWALLEGHWLGGILCTIVSLTAWGAALNEGNKR